MRLGYVIEPIAFGFGTAIVAVVGTNWGAKQYHRARRVAWTGAATIALLCEAPGTMSLKATQQERFGCFGFSVQNR
jgi:Na+-driven multidrug efflux pump